MPKAKKFERNVEFLHLISHIINDGKIQLKHSIGIMVLYLLEIIHGSYNLYIHFVVLTWVTLN